VRAIVSGMTSHDNNADASDSNAALDSESTFDAARFLASLPARPGVYAFYARDDSALYVGKATNLKHRVASYFRASNQNPKTRLMVAKIARAEIQQTATESEALLLENNLIKDKRPRYNISLRDDKSFPYIRLDAHAEFPRFSFYRGKRARPDIYYGPYPNATAVREMLAQLHKIFRLRQCTDAFFRNRSRPCLQYQIKRCSAPCVGRIARDDYRDDVRQAQAMLAGRDSALSDELAGKMERAAAALDYESAAKLRDRIALIQRARGAQSAAAGQSDADVVAVAVEAGVACFGVMSIRHGRNLGARFQARANPLDLRPAALLEAFLGQNYLGDNGAHVPAEILVAENINSRVSLQQAFALEGKRVVIKHRCRAHRAKWLEAARINTAEHLRAHLNQRAQVDAQRHALTELLALDEQPARIECFDISHTMGECAVGACVAFDAQGPVKSDYRKFNIDGVEPGDDYAALEQTLLRRYKRMLEEDGKCPDLILIDGGKGQLRAAAKALEELQLISQVALVAVAKGRARRAGDETLHVHGKRMRSVKPGASSPGLRLIQRARDEAHRFAITGHRKRRAKARAESPLQDVEGVGDKRRRNLLRHFGGWREIARAGVDDLAQAPGISLALAKKIYRRLHD